MEILTNCDNDSYLICIEIDFDYPLKIPECLRQEIEYLQIFIK